MGRTFQSHLRIRIRFLENCHFSLSGCRVSTQKPSVWFTVVENNFKFIFPSLEKRWKPEENPEGWVLWNIFDLFQPLCNAPKNCTYFLLSIISYTCTDPRSVEGFAPDDKTTVVNKLFRWIGYWSWRHSSYLSREKNVTATGEKMWLSHQTIRLLDVPRLTPLLAWSDVLHLLLLCYLLESNVSLSKRSTFGM